MHARTIRPLRCRFISPIRLSQHTSFRALHQTTIAREEMNTHTHINECTVVYFPQLGYLLAIPRDRPMTGNDRVDLPGLEFQVRGFRLYIYTSVSAMLLTRVVALRISTVICNIWILQTVWFPTACALLYPFLTNSLGRRARRTTRVHG